jgi:uncharacterized protein YndB with AHSA1/START domain
MQYQLKPDFPLTDKSCREATGKTLKEWFALLDERNALKLGRRDTNVLLRDEFSVPDWWCVTIAVEYEIHKEQRKKDGYYEGYFICSTKALNAPVDDVYVAWTDNAKLSTWFGNNSTAKVVDGGSFGNADGDKGSYLRVRPGKDLRFTWEHADFSPGSIVDVVFQDKGKGKTGMLVNHSRIQSKAEADGLRAAWGEALARLKELLEA